MPVSISGTNGVTFPDSSLQAAAASPYVLKNRIINGAMVIDQRNAGAATANTINDYTVDRWSVLQSVIGKLIAQQNAAAVTPPTGFSYYLGVTSQSNYSVLTGDYYMIRQPIEGYNVADFGFGTANAKTVTLSFWVRSSLTGTFGGSLRNSAGDRSYPFTYTISSANTWEQKSITIAGDTSGTWLTTTGIGLIVQFGLGVGSTYSGTAGAWAATNYVSATGATSVVGTSGATFYITGVQLEQNTTATPFERRLYGQELVNCQRYFQKIYGGSPYGGIFAGGSVFNMPVIFNPPCRSTPTISISSVSGWTIHNAIANVTFTGININDGATSFSTQLNLTGTSSGTVASYGHLRCYDGSIFNTASWLAFSAEL